MQDPQMQNSLVHQVEDGVPTPAPLAGPATGSEYSGLQGFSLVTKDGYSSDNCPTASSPRALLGKASPIVIATDVEATEHESHEMTHMKRRKVNILLDRCKKARCPFKRKLIFDNLNLTANDVPVRDLSHSSLGNSLQELSLSGNRLTVVSDLLVCCLPVLKILEMSHCSLRKLPEKWDLPKLKRLNLSLNCLADFPHELMLGGIPKLQDLNMYGNKITEVVMPRNPKVLSELKRLNLGYNDLVSLPDELDQLESLRHLEVQNNFLEKVPRRVCDMRLRTIVVSSNPIIQPPIEICERGVYSMKTYYACLRLEERDKQRMLRAAKMMLDKLQRMYEKKFSRGLASEIEHIGTQQQGNAASSCDARCGSDDVSQVAASISESAVETSLPFTDLPSSVLATDEPTEEVLAFKRTRINLLLDQCEAARFPWRKNLILENLNLTFNDIPVRELCNTFLGKTLQKLSLSGNGLFAIPDILVCSLPVLKVLDLSQCDLSRLPEKWSLPLLDRLNLSHNRITDFPCEDILGGLPMLRDLNMYGNRVAHIVVPRNPSILSKLQRLNLGYNDLSYLPNELDQLKSLRHLEVQHNFLEKIPPRVCDMGLRSIDVFSNPTIQPPIETCERGIYRMKRYYESIRLEEQRKLRK